MSSLKDLISQLRAQTSESSRPSPVKPNPITLRQPASGTEGNAAFVGTFEDENYIARLKDCFNGHVTYTTTRTFDTLIQLEAYCAERQVKYVATTQTHLLKKLVEYKGYGSAEKATLSNYAGSLFKYNGLEIVFINPLPQLLSVSYGKFITARYISKLVNRKAWLEPTAFKWGIFDPATVETHYAQFQTATAIAIDIETFKQNLAIRCISFTALWLDNSGERRTYSLVIPVDSIYALEWVRRFCDLDVQKVFQNGKYDNSYLLRYAAPVRNWQWDTINCMHCWYSELPKDLAFINAFFLREVVYWKDSAETTDLFEYYRYNAMDGWATINSWISWIYSAPDWAKRNYTLEFPLNFPCLLSELTGIERDLQRLEEARKKVDAEESVALKKLRSILGVANFNPGSSQQVLKLYKLFGCEDVKSTVEKDLAKVKLRHPIIGAVVELVLEIRGLRKLATNYLRLSSDADKNGEGGGKELCGRILYAINPHGTDTGRCASKEHHFWIGLQIQNIPRGPEVKCTLRASNGFYLGECDLEQAESRDTAYISGDTALMQAVESDKDFHSLNCSAFFGVSYNDIYDDEAGKPKNKKLRDLSKRVNHGANYNMGPGVLVDTMGLDKIWEAKKLLRLPFSEPKQVAEYLLACFHRTYKAIAGKYYESVKKEIAVSRKLVSRAYHHTEYNHKNNSDVNAYIDRGDWTRYCFGNPEQNKRDLNSYVAHCPQSLNARTLNEAYLRVFYEIALPNPKTFRLHAQIHDSILFSYAHDREDHAERVRESMQIPVTLRDVSGITRTFTVPAACKLGLKQSDGSLKRAIYWSETE